MANAKAFHIVLIEISPICVLSWYQKPEAHALPRSNLLMTGVLQSRLSIHSMKTKPSLLVPHTGCLINERRFFSEYSVLHHADV